MKPSALALPLAALALASGPDARAEHFTGCHARTGGSATLLVPAALDGVDGQPLEAGDEIAVLTPGGVCAGAGVWEGGNLAIAVWEDDEHTPEVDGFAEGEPLAFAVWDASAGVEQAGLWGSYDGGYETAGTFQPGAIYALDGFSTAPTSAPPEPDAPTFALRQNYPNPFRNRTTAMYDLATAAHVTLEVFNVLGQRVAILAEGLRSAGRHEVTFDARALASGVYFYRLRAASFEATRQMLVVR